MQLTLDFTLEELVISQTAERQGLDNSPSADIIDNLTNLCVNLLQPLRDHINQAIHISSGYRSVAVNAAVGGTSNSQHVLGQAADTSVFTMSTPEWAQTVISSGILFDQLILEFYDPAKGPNSGWVHLSWQQGCRNEIWTAKRMPNGKTEYYRGLVI